MIIRNIGNKAKSRRKNIFRRFTKHGKLKALTEKIYVPYVILLTILFFSASIVLLFTPANTFISGVLYKSVFSQYNQYGNNDSSADNNILSGLFAGNLNRFKNLDISGLLLSLSYPMIEIENDIKTDVVGVGTKNTLDYQDAFSDSDTGNIDIENSGSIYKDMPITNDAPILSIYEHYENASGAKIEEVGANIDGREKEIPLDTFRITPVNFSGQKTSVPQLLLNNQTSFNIDLSDFIKLKYPIRDADISNSEPVVLILCTHATESYCETGTFYYAPAFTAERTSDVNKNIVLIASELKSTLEEYGIPVIQSLKLHDEVSYQNSYIRSLETMNAYLKEYPSIKYVIDVHRDSMIINTGEKYKPTININGKNAAQIMMVIGTSDGGGNHPNWTDNLTFAAYMQQRLNDKYPMLARPVNLRSARFNQHVTKGSIILEVGSCGSSFDEAIYSARLFGECLAELIKDNAINSNSESINQ